MAEAGASTLKVEQDEKPDMLSLVKTESVTEPGSSSLYKTEDGVKQGVGSSSASTSKGSTSTMDEDALLKEFFSDMKAVDRDNEVNRILWAFKLNPFEKLNMRFDKSVEDVRRQYRKVSLMIHPDKCSHPQASAAFEIIGQAQKELLDDEKRDNLMRALNFARDDVRKERRKATKDDAAVALAAVLHERGREGVEEDWEQSDEFHEKWKMKARDVLAQGAWRKRKLDTRIKEETARCEADEKETKEKMKKAREHHKEWEQTRDTRVGTWRDFMTKSKDKGKVAGQLKPPKLKTNDDDKLYVQRPVGEQFRPPPPKGGKKSGGGKGKGK